MPGGRINAYPLRALLTGYSSAAVTAAQVLVEYVVPGPLRVGAVVVNAVTAGTGAGNTVVDVLKNGTTMYSTTANRPTLLATATGEFANTAPDVRTLGAGDRVTLSVASISSTGHA